MPKVTFTTVYGDETRLVEISQSNPNVTTMQIKEQSEGETGWSLIGSLVYYGRIGWTVVQTYQERSNPTPKEIADDIRFKRRSFTTDDKDAILGRLVDAGMIGKDEVINWR